jgi:hypothetical protein
VKTRVIKVLFLAAGTYHLPLSTSHSTSIKLYINTHLYTYIRMQKEKRECVKSTHILGCVLNVNPFLEYLRKLDDLRESIYSSDT